MDAIKLEQCHTIEMELDSLHMLEESYWLELEQTNFGMVKNIRSTYITK